MEKQFLSTSKLAELKGSTVSNMFEKLIQLGLMIPIQNPTDSNNKWELTEKGKEMGGRFVINDNFRNYIEWPIDIDLKNSIIMSSSKQNKSLKMTANTEGEICIKEFLTEIGMKYQQQEVIRGLPFDNKTYRVADFYLIKYQIYVEFLGNWNTNEIFRQEYKDKMESYKKNRIPCIYLYPENLGCLEFILDYRLMETLKEHQKDTELKYYQRWKFLKGAQMNIFGFLLFTFLSTYFLLNNQDGKIVVLILWAYNLYKIIYIWYLIFVNKRYSLSKMLYD